MTSYVVTQTGIEVGAFAPERKPKMLFGSSIIPFSITNDAHSAIEASSCTITPSINQQSIGTYRLSNTVRILGILVSEYGDNSGGKAAESCEDRQEGKVATRVH